jgi:chromatin remodeling complex protein RSC6
MSNVEDRITQLELLVKTLQTKLTRTEKAFRKFKKSLIPESERKVRQPSGFAKPSKLSPGLCKFLGLDADEELARTEVTKRVLNYVKEQGLQNTEHRKFINLDEKLTELLKPAPDEKVSYFSIQRLLKVHYPSKAAVSPTPAPVVAETVVAEPVVAEPVVADKKTKVVKKKKAT